MLNTSVTEMELNDIIIDEVSLNKIKSCSLKIGTGLYYIGIDTSNITCNAELNTALYHELGHCRTDAFYGTDATKIEIIRAEHQADKWAITNCIPYKEYLEAISKGVSDVWQLSEYFNITIENARKVIDFYESKLKGA